MRNIAAKTHKKKIATLIGRCAAVLFLLVVCFYHLKASFLIQIAQNRGQQQYTFSSSQTDPIALANIARREHLLKGNLDKAAEFYRQSLTGYILHIPAWLGLAELFYDLGNNDKAEKILEFVEQVAGNGRMAWERALLANMLERHDILERNLAWVVENMPGKRKDVFALADMVWSDPETLVQKIGISHSPDLLLFYIRAGELEKSKILWSLIRETTINEPRIFLNFVNYLLHNKQYKLAGEVWRACYAADGNMLYNQSLQLPFVGSGFGWRVSGKKGFQLRNPEQGQGLQILFDGSENIHFRFAQKVLLSPGEYIFSGSMQSEAISTDQRPYWSLRGLGCKFDTVRDDMIPSTGKEIPLNLDFTVPQSCDGVELVLQRKKSYYFDNKISGKLSIQGLKLAKSGD